MNNYREEWDMEYTYKLIILYENMVKYCKRYGYSILDNTDISKFIEFAWVQTKKEL
jgi:hypothetical protein